MTTKTGRNGGAAIAAVIAATAALALPSGPAAGQSNKAMLIIDSSRSMWGQIDGVNKVVHAREALARFFKRQEDAFRLGVMAYGHQQDSGCDDFAVLKGVGGIDAGAYASAVNNIAPKGSTPITAALDAAAETMAKTSGRQHIILLSDGLDNCKGDPCARAQALAQSRPQLTLHAIAFDKASEKASLEALACVAEPSRGMFRFASSREELDAALDAVAARITAPPAPKPVPGLTMEDANPDTPVPIRLTAYLAGNEEQVRQGLSWRIFAGRAGDDGRYALIEEPVAAQPTVELKPGTYFLHVSWGMAHTTKRLEVVPGQPAHEQIIIKAGAIRLSARQASGAPIAAEDVRFEIYSEETDQFGNRERLIANAPAGPAIRLNSGEYYVVSSYGDSNAIVESKIEVQPGKLSEVILIHDAVRVTFRLVERRGGEAIADTRWTVKGPDGKVIKQSAGAFPTHVLTAGSYRVEAQHGEQLFSREFELAGGGARQIEVLKR
jgi:hypothetical protein